MRRSATSLPRLRAPARAALGALLLGATTLLAPSEAPAGDDAAPGSTTEARPLVQVDGLGDARSPVPTAKEWQGAPRVALDRTSERAAGCVASQVREWVRVRCPDKTFAISLLGGSNEGLAFWIGPEAEGGWGEVQFPMRRGDRRVVQLWRARPDGAGGSTIEPSIVLQEHWLATEARPRISAL